jgi:transposase-like protein
MGPGRLRRQRRSFTDEFKAEVARTVLSSGKTAGQVARELDLTETAVRQWVKQAQMDFKSECGERFETNEIAETKAFEYIEAFYNRQRRHSAISYISPAEFERRFTEGQAA